MSRSKPTSKSDDAGDRGGFIRSVILLAGGSALSRSAMVLALPILTRIYTPEDFGVLAVFTAVVTLVSVVACLRLEIAIPIPDNTRDAANLLALSLVICTAISLLVAVVIYGFSNEFVLITDQPLVREFLWMCPIGVLLAGWYSGLQYWATRKNRFGSIARTRLMQGIGGAGTQIGVGLLGFAPIGLILGYLVSIGAGSVALLRSLISHDRVEISGISFARMRVVLRKFSRFPKFSSLDALANSAGTQLPLILIASLSSGPEAGFVLLAMRAMGTPMGLIGSAVGQVYLSKAPAEFRAGTLGEFTADTLTGLLRSATGPLIFAGIIAAPLFDFVFGGNWVRAGELVTWMTPWFVFQFLSSPVSLVGQVTGKQKLMLAVSGFGLLSRLGAVLVASYVFSGYIAEAYAIGAFVYYSVLAIVVYRIAGITASQLLSAWYKSFHFILAWVFAGVLASQFLSF